MESEKAEGGRPEVAAASEMSAVLGVCWWFDNGEFWESDCEKAAFVFNDGGPNENGFEFCPYCGKRLGIEVEFEG